MRAGNLRHRLIIQEPTVSQAATGVVSKTWAEVAKVWGNVEPMTGRDLWHSQQVQPEATHRVTVRHRQLRSEYRVLYPVEYIALDGDINSAVTAVTVSSGFTSDSKNYRLRIDDELCEVTGGHDTTSLTVTRGVDGTTAAAHTDGTNAIRMEMLGIDGPPQNVDGRDISTELLCKVIE